MHSRLQIFFRRSVFFVPYYSVWISVSSSLVLLWIPGVCQVYTSYIVPGDMHFTNLVTRGRQLLSSLKEFPGKDKPTRIKQDWIFTVLI